MFTDQLAAFGLTVPMAFGLISAALSVLAYLPYMRDTVRDVTQPHRSSWFIWSVLSCIAFFSLLHEGVGMALYFAAAQAGCTTVIFLLSLSHGQGKWVTPADGLVLCVAGLGLIAWAVTDSALYALGISITISLMGGALTVAKAFRAPDSETTMTWALSWLAASAALAGLSMSEVGALDIRALDPIAASYPLYLFTLNGAIVAALIMGQVRCSAAVSTNLGRNPRLLQPEGVPSKGLMPRPRPPFPPLRQVARR